MKVVFVQYDVMRVWFCFHCLTFKYKWRINEHSIFVQRTCVKKKTIIQIDNYVGLDHRQLTCLANLWSKPQSLQANEVQLAHTMNGIQLYFSSSFFIFSSAKHFIAVKAITEFEECPNVSQSFDGFGIHIETIVKKRTKEFWIFLIFRIN